MGLASFDFELPWAEQLVAVDDGARAGVTVASLLPAGYQRYVRVFHPFVPWEAEFGYASRSASWRELAQSVGVPFGPVLTWRQLSPALQLSEDGQSRPWAVWDGELELAAADALFEDLAQTSVGPFYFGFGLSAAVFAVEGRVFAADSLTQRVEVVSELRALGALVNSCELVWPADQAWIVCTDWDLTSTYVAADRATAGRILSDERLEAIEVTLGTRVDQEAHLQT